MDVQSFFDFVAASPSAFHACKEACCQLARAGFVPLNEYEPWVVKPGGKYYVTRNLSSVIAFRVPKTGLAPFQIVASHSDSPVFKLKPKAEEAKLDHYVRLNVEKYGGMIMSTWLDRPLSIAGRALVKMDGHVQTMMVDLARDAVMIPNMPIHFNRDMNDGFKFDPQVDLLPLYGDETSAGGLEEEIAQMCGVDKKDVVASDLFLYNRMPGTQWGAKGEFISCPRIDDLECAFTSLTAFINAEKHGNTAVYALFDNEEVGSRTKQGADSSFLTDVLFRLCADLGADDADTRKMIAGSFMVSADNAHAVHPNHPEKYDADNRTWMNGGVVIKHNANQAYTTDAVSDAVFTCICEKAKVPVQHFSNLSNLAGGSTLGNIANTHISINTVDIGLAQLAMHSSYETAGAKDLTYMTDALRKFYETTIHFRMDGMFTLA